MTSDEKYFTIEEVAKLFKVTRQAVYKWMANGDIHFVYVGKHRQITKTDLRNFVKPGNQQENEQSQGNTKPALVFLAYETRTNAGYFS